jgi:hypothetical protein
MAKTRISISLDPEHAERIRSHAERAGLDVSAYLVNAATRQMAEAEAIEANFAHVDAMIAAAESEAAALEPLPETSPDELTEEERQDIEAAIGLVYGADNPSARPGNTA